MSEEQVESVADVKAIYSVSSLAELKSQFESSTDDEKENLFEEMKKSNSIPLIAMTRLNNHGTTGCLYLGNHTRKDRTYTIFSKKDGKLDVEEITTNEPKFLQGFDYGDSDTLILIYDGEQYSAIPFEGLAAFVDWHGR